MDTWNISSGEIGGAGVGGSVRGGVDCADDGGGPLLFPFPCTFLLCWLILQIMKDRKDAVPGAHPASHTPSSTPSSMIAWAASRVAGTFN